MHFLSAASWLIEQTQPWSSELVPAVYTFYNAQLRTQEDKKMFQTRVGKLTNRSNPRVYSLKM